MRALTSAALLLVCATLGACGNGENNAADEAIEAKAPPRVEISDAEKQARLASLPAPYNTADIANGQRKFAICRSCHTLTDHGPTMTGPNLHALFGRKAGSHDFNYSEALKTSGITWDAASLDKWIESPRTTVPGTKMAFAGIKDPKDRIDLIGYLKTEAGDED